MSKRTRDQITAGALALLLSLGPVGCSIADSSGSTTASQSTVSGSDQTNGVGMSGRLAYASIDHNLKALYQNQSKSIKAVWSFDELKQAVDQASQEDADGNDEFLTVQVYQNLTSENSGGEDIVVEGPVDIYLTSGSLWNLPEVLEEKEWIVAELLENCKDDPARLQQLVATYGIRFFDPLDDVTEVIVKTPEELSNLIETLKLMSFKSQKTGDITITLENEPTDDQIVQEIARTIQAMDALDVSYADLCAETVKRIEASKGTMNKTIDNVHFTVQDGGALWFYDINLTAPEHQTLASVNGGYFGAALDGSIADKKETITGSPVLIELNADSKFGSSTALCGRWSGKVVIQQGNQMPGPDNCVLATDPVEITVQNQDNSQSVYSVLVPDWYEFGDLPVSSKAFSSLLNSQPDEILAASFWTRCYSDPAMYSSVFTIRSDFFDSDKPENYRICYLSIPRHLGPFTDNEEITSQVDATIQIMELTPQKISKKDSEYEMVIELPVDKDNSSDEKSDSVQQQFYVAIFRSNH